MSTSNAEQSSMITNDSPAELRDVILEVNQKFRLFMRDNIIEMDVLVTPLKVMNDTFVCQLLLHDEDVLEEVHDTLLNVEVIKFSYHCLLILQISLICVNKSISFINYIPDIIENSTVCA